MANRDYRSLPSYRPTVNEWKDFLGKQGDDGGLAAEVVDDCDAMAINEGMKDAECMKEMAENWVKDPWMEEGITKQNLKDGKRDFYDTLKLLKEGKTGKTVPSWSVPVEMLGAVLQPSKIRTHRMEQNWPGL